MRKPRKCKTNLDCGKMGYLCPQHVAMPSPLPIPSPACGCKLVIDVDPSDERAEMFYTGEIAYCPTHAAAFEMRETIQKYLENYGCIGNIYFQKLYDLRDALQQAEARK